MTHYTMISPDNDLPRLYLIKQCKEDLEHLPYHKNAGLSTKSLD